MRMKRFCQRSSARCAARKSASAATSGATVTACAPVTTAAASSVTPRTSSSATRADAGADHALGVGGAPGEVVCAARAPGAAPSRCRGSTVAAATVGRAAVLQDERQREDADHGREEHDDRERVAAGADQERRVGAAHDLQLDPLGGRDARVLLPLVDVGDERVRRAERERGRLALGRRLPEPRRPGQVPRALRRVDRRLPRVATGTVSRVEGRVEPGPYSRGNTDL